MGVGMGVGVGVPGGVPRGVPGGVGVGVGMGVALAGAWRFTQGKREERIAVHIDSGYRALPGVMCPPSRCAWLKPAGWRHRYPDK